MILARLSSRRRSQNFVYGALIAFLIVFAGLRWEVGCDWPNYLRHYYLVSDPSFSPFNVSREHGWWILIDTVEYFGFPYYTINLIVAVTFFVSIHFFAQRQNDPIAFLIILFPMLILGIVMAAVRQAVAIGFVSLAFLAFADRAPIRMTIWILIASTFHVSALIFAPLIPLSWGKLNRNRLVFAIILAVPILFLVVSSENADRASNTFVGTDIVSRGALIRIGSLLSTAALFWFFLRKSWRAHSPYDYPLAMIMFLGTIALLPILQQSSLIADRLSYYFVPLQAMIVVRTQTLPGVANRQFLLVGQWMVLSIALIGWMSMSDHFWRCYEPYQSVIFGAS